MAVNRASLWFTAAGGGFEPPYPAPKAGVLPITPPRNVASLKSLATQGETKVSPLALAYPFTFASGLVRCTPFLEGRNFTFYLFYSFQLSPRFRFTKRFFSFCAWVRNRTGSSAFSEQCAHQLHHPGISLRRAGN
jgi:hypothetical protein